jgi:hypothetical protein
MPEVNIENPPDEKSIPENSEDIKRFLREQYSHLYSCHPVNAGLRG